MTIGSLKNQISELCRNEYSDSIITSWIDRIDRIIYNEIILNHEDVSPSTFNGYNQNTDSDTKLLVDSPYDGLYLDYIRLQIDIMNNETERQSVSANVFTDSYTRFANYYNRKHMPIQKRINI